MPTLDGKIVLFVAENLRCAFLDAVMPFITALGDGGLLWIVIALVLLLFRKTRCCGVAMIGALLFSLLLCNLIIKPIVARERPFFAIPEIVLLIPPPGETSFPSGHASSSFAAATAVLLFHKKSGVAALLIASLIAFSRLYLSVHYLSDILAGVVLGILCGFAAKKLLDILIRCTRIHNFLGKP